MIAVVVVVVVVVKVVVVVEVATAAAAASIVLHVVVALVVVGGDGAGDVAVVAVGAWRASCLAFAFPPARRAQTPGSRVGARAGAGRTRPGQARRSRSGHVGAVAFVGARVVAVQEWAGLVDGAMVVGCCDYFLPLRLACDAQTAAVCPCRQDRVDV